MFGHSQEQSGIRLQSSHPPGLVAQQAKLDAAIDHVVETGWIDVQRMCIAGWSYGGYSALISVVRQPERFRCAAAGAAPTDLPLMFNSSDWAAWEQARERMAERVGDPRKDYARMLDISPAYRAAEVRVPLLLAHGTDDRRVDIAVSRQLSKQGGGKVTLKEYKHPKDGDGHGLFTAEYAEVWGADFKAALQPLLKCK